MSFKKGDFRYDFEVRCPFNKNHQMPMSRLIFHISKGCADKKKKGHLYELCPYNSLHYLRKGLIQEHLQRCKDHLRHKAQDKFTKQDRVLMEQAIRKQFIEKEQINNDDNNQNLQKPQKPEVPDWGDFCDQQEQKSSDIYSLYSSEDFEEIQSKEINAISFMNFQDESISIISTNGKFKKRNYDSESQSDDDSQAESVSERKSIQSYAISSTKYNKPQQRDLNTPTQQISKYYDYPDNKPEQQYQAMNKYIDHSNDYDNQQRNEGNQRYYERDQQNRQNQQQSRNKGSDDKEINYSMQYKNKYINDDTKIQENKSQKVEQKFRYEDWEENDRPPRSSRQNQRRNR